MEIKHTPKFVISLKRGEYKISLELRKLYKALPDEDAAQHGYIRVVDGSGEDCLYPDNLFASIELPQAVEEALLAAA